MTDQKLQVIPLGGLGEFGMNMTAIRYGDDIIVVDCGMMFPDAELLGVDLVMPDLTFLKENQRIRARPGADARPRRPHRRGALFPLRNRRSGLRHGVSRWRWWTGAWKSTTWSEEPRFIKVKPKQIVEIGPFKIEFIHVTHSIVSAVALAITTPLGVIIHTGDFKVDPTPTDNELFDLHTLAEYGKRGVLLLLSDSTNSDRPGYTESERAVRPRMEEIFNRAERRIVVACFSSSIHRIQLVLDLAREYGRSVAVVGRSMVVGHRDRAFAGAAGDSRRHSAAPAGRHGLPPRQGDGADFGHAGRADVGAVARGRGQPQAHFGGRRAIRWCSARASFRATRRPSSA